jgi:hypothetical protein
MDTTPTGADLRRILLDRCDAFCRKTGAAPSALAKSLSGNSGFLLRVARGGNLTIDTYDEFMGWLQVAKKHSLAEAERRRLAGRPTQTRKPRRANGRTPKRQ